MTPKLAKELDNAYEMRTWREKLHVTKDGEVFIPPMALKNALSEAAKFLAMKIPGKGNSNYTKHFESGLLITEPILLGIHKDDVTHEVYFVPSNGERGGGKRVDKAFPVIPSWKGSTTIFVLDDIIEKEVLKQVLEACGQFIGLGRFRPQRNGFYGRFAAKVVSFG